MSASLYGGILSTFFGCRPLSRASLWSPSFNIRGVTPDSTAGSTLIDRTKVNAPEQKLAEAATHHLTTPDE